MDWRRGLIAGYLLVIAAVNAMVMVVVHRQAAVGIRSHVDHDAPISLLVGKQPQAFTEDADRGFLNMQHPAAAWALCQLSLVAVWLGLGRTPMAWRMCVSVVYCVWWSRLLALNVDHFVVMSKLTAYYLFVVAGILLLLRELGLQLVTGDIANSPHRTRQFSLLDLFSWVTATAITLAAIKTLVPPEYYRGWERFGWLMESEFILQADLVLVPAAFLTCASCWLVLGRWCWVGEEDLFFWVPPRDPRTRNPERIPDKFFPLVAIILASLVILNRVWTQAGWWPLVDLAVLLGSFGVFRLAGYRLIWQPARRHDPSADVEKRPDIAAKA